MQKQYATVTATNTAAACWLVGFPAVALRVGGQPLGGPAVPGSTPPPPLRLPTGATAQARLFGPSTCNAGVSDKVRISAPGQGQFTDVVLPMRGCPLTIDPFVLVAR